MERKVNVTKAAAKAEKKEVVQTSLPIVNKDEVKETELKKTLTKDTLIDETPKKETPKKEESKKEEPKKEVKTAEVKEAVKKPSIKKTIKKKATKEEAGEAVQEVFVQYAGQEVLLNDLMDRARQAYIAEGHRASAIKSIRLYVKPEEGMAYYVINEKASGGITLY